MSEYTELYKKLSLSELLKIQAESHKYKPVAVETAIKEIERRNLSAEDILEAHLYIENKNNTKKVEAEKRKIKKEKLKKSAFTFLETISPIQNGIRTPEKIIRLITILFAIIAIYKIYNEFWFLRFMFTDGLSKWDLSTIAYMLELILLPITVILFWKRKRIGWILLALLLTSSAMSAIELFFYNFNRKPSSFPGLNKLFPVVSPMVYVTAFIFHSASLWLICKKNVSSIFKVSEQTVFLSVSLTIIVQLIFILLN
jgi:hypothetical protein